MYIYFQAYNTQVRASQDMTGRQTSVSLESVKTHPSRA